MKYRYYNDHYLYIRTGVATEDQLKKSLESAIRRIGYSCRYKINFVMIKDKITHKNIYSGHSYVWLSNVKVSYILTNRNCNGSERFIIDDNGDRKYLKPLIILPGYKYTNEQLDHLEEIKINNEKVPEKGYFEIDRAWVTNACYRKVTSRLIGTGIPEWVTKELLYQEFSRYSSFENPIITIKKVNINGFTKRICDIQYDDDTTDGKFAMIMTKRTKFSNPVDPDQETLIYFNYYSPYHNYIFEN